ncbi:MAG: hypothetical protein ABF292_08000 [Desulfobacterales bacterium]
MKISIPKEAVEWIVANCGCTEEEAAKAFMELQELNRLSAEC